MNTTEAFPRCFVNYAHRGASAYAPENTFLSFYTWIFMGANGIETDVRCTKDGILVLYHDDTLVRMTGNPGGIQEYTAAELHSFYVEKNGLRDRIVLLEDFLSAFSFMDLHFAIELKQAGIEKDVVDLLNKYGMLEKTHVTSFDLAHLQTVRLYDPRYKTGYLTRNIDDELIGKLSSSGITQVCPKASDITGELVAKLHRAGFLVRAWGVGDECEMRRVYDCGADGMTVDAPDLLAAYIRQNL